MQASYSDEWERYWEDTPSSQAVYADKQGNAHQDIVAFWQSVIDKSIAEGCLRMVDIACGNGALFRSVKLPSVVALAGVDCSREALRQFTRSFPEARTFPMVDNVIPPLISNQHLYLSQFGIEYIGLEAFGQVAELMPSGSKFVALSHIREGHIWSRYRDEQCAITWVLQNGYIESVMEAVSALFTASFVGETKARFSFLHAQLRDLCERTPVGGHVHLYQGAVSLLAEWQSYEPSDISSWLLGMKRQLVTSESRLKHMCAVAITQEQVSDLQEALRPKVTSFSATPFYTSFASLPVAWHIRFAKK